MSLDPQPDTYGPLTGIAGKIIAGLLGAIVSLRWLPVEMTKLGRAVSVLGGFGAAMFVGPMIAELVEVTTSRGEAGIIFLSGLFGMMFAGEVISALKEAQIGPLLRDWLRKLFRVGG